MQLLTPDQRALQQACRAVLGDHSTSTRVRQVAESDSGHDAELWALATDLGWSSLAVPERLDGLGGTASDLAVIAEEFGRVVQPSVLTPTMAATWFLSRHAPDGCADDVLEAVNRGARLSWAASKMSAAVSGERPADLLVRPDGRLSGVMEFIPEGQSAELLLLTAQSESGPQIVLVDPASPGVSLTPMSTLDLTRRYCRLTVAPHSAVTPLAFPVDQDTLDSLEGIGVVLQCAESTGVAAKLLEMTIAYLGQRSQFGQLIGSFQALKHRVADMLIEVEGSRVSTREAAEALESGADAREAISVAKSWVGRGASYVASNALQLHGGIGFSWEHDLHLYLRRAKTNELLLGTPRWHEERLTRLIAPAMAST